MHLISYGILLLILTEAAAFAAAIDSPRRRPVKDIANQHVEVRAAAGNGVLPLYLSRDWTTPQPDITRVVIVFHGLLGNAAVYLRAAQRATASVSEARTTLLIAPQFITDRDTITYKLPHN